MPIPDVNTPVLLRGDDEEYASRVEGLDETALTLARPFGLPLEPVLEDGREFAVEWTTASGVHALPVRVTERAIDGKIRVWHARPTGPARIANRRAHLRVPVAVPLILEVDGEEINASVLDVSEAAVRCLVRERLPQPETDARGNPVEQQIRVIFSLSDQDFTLRGTIFRSTPTTSGVELIVSLPEDEATATSVRRAVFAEQIRARQMSR